MTRVSVDALKQPIPHALLWGIFAALAGVLVASQPYPPLLIGGIAIGLILLSLVTPYVALMALLVLAPMRTLITTEAQFQLPLDIGQFALLGLILAYVVYQIVRNQPFIATLHTPLLIPLLAFIGITGFSAFVAISLTAWLNEWLKWVQILMLLILTLNMVRANQWEWLVFGIVLSGVANSIVGVYQFFGGSGALHLVINGRYFRAFGTFGQPNPFGGFMGLLAPIALMAALGYLVRQWKLVRSIGRFSSTGLLQITFYSVSSLLILIGIGMSWSRGAWLGLAGAFAVMMLALPRNTRRGILVLGIGFAIVGLLWFIGALPTSFVERLNSSTQEFFAFEDVRGVDITPDNFAVAERLAHWQAAVNMATAHPFLGVGFGNYEAAYPSYRLLNWFEPLGHAHNYYLNILAEVGILGLLGYGKVWLSIIWVTWQGRNHPDDLSRFIVIGLLGSWVYLSIHSFFDNLYVNNIFLHLGLMLGILAILYNQMKTTMKVSGS